MNAAISKHLGNLWRAAIAGGVVAVPVFAAGADDRALIAAFATPFVGWLALAYSVNTQRLMNSSPTDTPT